MLDIRLQEVAGYLEMEMVLISTDAECEKFHNVHRIRIIDKHLIFKCNNNCCKLYYFAAHKSETSNVFPVMDVTADTVLENEDAV